MKKAKVLSIFSLLIAVIVVSSFTTPPPATDSTGTSTPQEGDSIYYADPLDTLWNVVVYVEFGVHEDGVIYDVLAEEQYDCIKCDTSMIDSLKAQAVKTVQEIGVWENLQHKDIRYEYPIHMLKTHKDVHHDVYHHEDSLRQDQD